MLRSICLIAHLIPIAKSGVGGDQQYRLSSPLFNHEKLDAKRGTWLAHDNTAKYIRAWILKIPWVP